MSYPSRSSIPTCRLGRSVRVSLVVLPLALMLVFGASLASADTRSMTPKRPPMSVAALGGPSVSLRPSGGDALGWFGAELIYGKMSSTMLINPSSGAFTIRFLGKYVYDYWMLPQLALSLSGGLDLGLVFTDPRNIFALGLTVGGRLTYMLTPKIGLFVEPANFDFPFFVYISSDQLGAADYFGFRVSYRALGGATFRF
jgi:hypothetical protein